MISKSMSRKTASFSQLIAYMDCEKSDAAFDVHHNCYARGQTHLAGEFFANSQHLTKRKNGNILYHEIVSISLEDGVDRIHAKDCLREIALKYIQMRCPCNLVYGTLHDDHADHLHYHLMISANERGASQRFWHSKAQYETIKRDLEEYVLTKFPELKQSRLQTTDGETIGQGGDTPTQDDTKEPEKPLTAREAVADAVLAAMEQASSFDSFEVILSENGLNYYTRGKTHGVKQAQDEGRERKFRFSALGVQGRFDAFMAEMQAADQVKDLEVIAGEKEKDELLVVDDVVVDEEAESFLDEMQQLRAVRQAKRGRGGGLDHLST